MLPNSLCQGAGGIYSEILTKRSPWSEILPIVLLFHELNHFTISVVAQHMQVVYAYFQVCRADGVVRFRLNVEFPAVNRPPKRIPDCDNNLAAAQISHSATANS